MVRAEIRKSDSKGRVVVGPKQVAYHLHELDGGVIVLTPVKETTLDGPTLLKLARSIAPYITVNERG